MTKCILLISLEYQNVFKISEPLKLIEGNLRIVLENTEAATGENGVLKNSASFTRRHRCWSLFLMKLKK